MDERPSCGTSATAHFLVLAAVLFLIGVAGVLLRRNALIILMGIELHAQRRQPGAADVLAACGAT